MAIRTAASIAGDEDAADQARVSAARLLLRGEPDDEDAKQPKVRPTILFMPENRRDIEIAEATRARVLAGELVNVVPLCSPADGDDWEARNAALRAAMEATLDRLYPESDEQDASRPMTEAGVTYRSGGVRQCASWSRRRRRSACR